ncbi:MAG: PLP-dependent aminotransferase family protein [Candidatus Promineifilaceae bacterium]
MFNFQPSPLPLQTTQTNLQSDVIHFGTGQPGMDILPLDIMREAAAHRLAIDDTAYLNYGKIGGGEHFHHALAQFLTDTVGTNTTRESLFITGGNSQALDLICTVFTDYGDTVFVEEPTYFLALQIFADHGLNVVGIPMDEEGLRIDVLEEKLAEHRPKLIYTIPAFHNPTSVNLSAERRQQLIKLSQTHNFLIAADEVYQLLYYGDPPPAPFSAFIDSGTILSMGTFSKIMAPGLRLGWIETSAELRKKLLRVGFGWSGGSLNHFTSGIVRSAIELGLQHQYLHKLRTLFRHRIEVMDAAIQAHFPAEIRYQKPTGGYFFWLELPEHINADAIRLRAISQKVGFHAGPSFSSEQGLQNYFRLAFSFYSDDVIQAGIEQLGHIFSTELAR